MTSADREALERAVALTLAEPDPGRVAQVRSKLADDWEEAGKFCAYHRQIEVLRLPPYESPPCCADAVPIDGDPSLAMLNELIDAGLSRWEPAPVEALRSVKRRKH